MTKEELEKEARKYIKQNYCEMCVMADDCKSGCIDCFTVQAYLAGAEPREKQIAELKDEIHTWKEASSANSYKAFQLQEENKTLAQHILELQNDKGELTDRCKGLEAQIEKMKKYAKLLQDICTVMGNDPYMVSVGLENRVKVLWDSSEEKDGLKMVEDIENRLLEIKPQDWAEIEKWEIKEK